MAKFSISVINYTFHHVKCSICGEIKAIDNCESPINPNYDLDRLTILSNATSDTFFDNSRHALNVAIWVDYKFAKEEKKKLRVGQTIYAECNIITPMNEPERVILIAYKIMTGYYKSQAEIIEKHTNYEEPHNKNLPE